jgi:hypothetical protein
MIKPSLCTLLLICFGFVTSSRAQEYRIETFEGPAPSDGLSEAVKARIGTNGLRVTRGEDRTICEIWLCQEWEIRPDFKPTEQVLYPFTPGQLIGVVRFARRANDFRDQALARGVYTLRYAQQPVDGNHQGTSPTRDFLLMVQAQNDPSPDAIEAKALQTASAKAAETSHPAMLCLQRVQSSGQRPSIRHDEEHDWWIAEIQGKAKAGEQVRDLAVDLIVVGHASE